MPVTTPSAENVNWKSVLKAGIFSFLSGFIGFFVAQGGFDVDLGWNGLMSLLGGAIVSGVNVGMFAAWQLIEDKG